MKTLSYTNIIDILLGKVPDFSNKAEEIIKEYGLLPHVVFAELKNFFFETYTKTITSKTLEETNYKIIREILNFIEEIVICHIEEVRELAYVSFLETLNGTGEDYENIKKLLRPNSRDALHRIEIDWGKFITEFNDHSLAGVIRLELTTNRLLGGVSHIRKGEERVHQLERWLQNNSNASKPDKNAAIVVLNDLKDALKSKVKE